MTSADWSKLFENVSQIKLKGSLSAKIIFALSVTVISVSMAGIATGVAWMTFTLGVLAIVLAGGTLFGLLYLANRNPQAFILEGGEFL